MTRRKKVPYKEVEGSSVLSAANYERVLIRQAESMYQYEPVLDGLFEEDIIIRSFSVRHPQDVGDDYLLTVRATVGGAKMVAFHGGETLIEVVTGLTQRLKNRTIQWKVDSYA